MFERKSQQFISPPSNRLKVQYHQQPVQVLIRDFEQDYYQLKKKLPHLSECYFQPVFGDFNALKE
jgi:hypothetical protein